jgi:anti-sigma regulatory factor (Ser/Thr protein kinase)
MADEVRVDITTDADLVTARAEGRAMAERLGFPRPDPTLIATAISEVARNIVVHVGRGEIVLKPFEDANRPASVTSRRPSGTTTAEGAASASACRGHGGSWTTSRSSRAPTAARL